MTDVMVRLRAANPVPRDLSTGWSSTTEGEGRRAEVDWKRDAPRRRRPWPAAVAAVLVLLLVATVAVVAREGGDVETAGRSTIQRLARGTWHALPPLPSSLGEPTPLWTGKELIVWGSDSGFELVDGRWRRLPDWGSGVRSGATVRWTGDEMIVWGGTPPGTDATPTWGAAYDPRSRTWRELPSSPVMQAPDSTATWTGRELIVTNGSVVGPVGASYDPRTDEWSPLPDLSPSLQANPSASAAWDGTRIVFTTRFPLAAVEYRPDANRWAVLPAPPSTGLSNAIDLIRHRHAVVEIGWNSGIDPPGSLQAAVLRPTFARWVPGTSRSQRSMCAVRAAAVPEGAAVFCSVTDGLFYDVARARWASMPEPPGRLGELVWTGTSLVSVDDQDVMELTTG